MGPYLVRIGGFTLACAAPLTGAALIGGFVLGAAVWKGQPVGAQQFADYEAAPRVIFWLSSRPLVCPSPPLSRRAR
jgi:hypothetical protein